MVLTYLAIDGTLLDDGVEHVLRSQGEQLVVSLGRVERRLPRARYVRGEGVLDGEDVAAHFLHAVLVDLADVGRRLDEEARHQVRHPLEDVPCLVLRQRGGQDLLDGEEVCRQPRHLLVGVGRVLAAGERRTGGAVANRVQMVETVEANLKL